MDRTRRCRSARSLDLTILDYFLWDFIKNQVMATTSTIREDMKDRIGQAYYEITIKQLIKVRQAFQSKFQRYIPTTRR